jgi:hypothetical protein
LRLFAEDLVANHLAIEQLLLDQRQIDAFKSRLSSSWEIVGMDNIPFYIQGNWVGRAIGAAAKGCGVSMVWENQQQASRAIWPVVLADVSTTSIEGYLARPWVAAGVSPPGYLEGASEELARRVAEWGIAFLTLSIDRPNAAEEVNYVFIDRHRVTPENDRAVLDYAVASAMVGLSSSEGSPVDPDYSYLAGWQQQLEALAGTNATRLERVCHAMLLTAELCAGNAAPAMLPQLLTETDTRCEASGGVVKGLADVEAKIEKYAQTLVVPNGP